MAILILGYIYFASYLIESYSSQEIINKCLHLQSGSPTCCSTFIQPDYECSFTQDAAVYCLDQMLQSQCSVLYDITSPYEELMKVCGYNEWINILKAKHILLKHVFGNIKCTTMGHSGCDYLECINITHTTNEVASTPLNFTNIDYRDCLRENNNNYKCKHMFEVLLKLSEKIHNSCDTELDSTVLPHYTLIYEVRIQFEYTCNARASSTTKTTTVSTTLHPTVHKTGQGTDGTKLTDKHENNLNTGVIAGVSVAIAAAIVIVVVLVFIIVKRKKNVSSNSNSASLPRGTNNNLYTGLNMDNTGVSTISYPPPEYTRIDKSAKRVNRQQFQQENTSSNAVNNPPYEANDTIYETTGLANAKDIEVTMGKASQITHNMK